MDINFITVNGVRLAYLEQGKGPLLICLHGFPDTAYSFTHLMDTFSAQGYRVVSVFLRGYYPSGLAIDDDYSIPTVARDIVELIAALGEETATLIGHDWGGFTAYTAANLNPAVIDKIVVMAVPHLHHSTFSWQQLRKSWYVMLFQLPKLPEYLVAKNDYAFIDRLYKSWCPNWSEAEFQLQPVKKALAFAGGLKAALAYYRAMIRGSTARDRALMSQQTSVPALWISGDADGSIDPGQFVGIEKAFTSQFELLSIPNAGHFVHREATHLVENKILSFLR
ncbi:alpha/beta fold hydrolase [Oceanicoccus sp. KOV_DT_Chl]|uniref:alpha/beta fold hydrolase n=1 Tax=Oceanicoccus sp. KOV_DT_Chl TaxID=1904639 RepID=UPI00135854AA|nr:alpha/beta hydrolase [Oceanicoccus sp. KOV_DT_Chl]